MDSSSSALANKSIPENPNPDPSQNLLKCPRCDSSNTKFCYYNNHSLSQPRHFCKACKRYWTRGGTLRNVPVGGGCRKNKKVKRLQPTGSDLAKVSCNMNSMPTNPHELNFQFSGFGSTRVSLDPSRFDVQNGYELGFSWGLIESEIQNQGRNQDFNLGDPIFNVGSKFISSGLKEIHDYNFSGLMMPYLDDQDMVRMRNGDGVVNHIMGKEGGENRLEWNNQEVHNQQHINSSSDCFSLFGNSTNNLGSCFYTYSNIGSSVPSLI